MLCINLSEKLNYFLFTLPVFIVLTATFSLSEINTARRQKISDFKRVIVGKDQISKTAGEELAYYIERITGNKIEIVPIEKYDRNMKGLSFFIGEEVTKKVLELSYGPWKQEEYMLISTPEGIILAGDDGTGDVWSISTRAGTMLAVYTLLEDFLGVHWFWPGPYGEHIPYNPNASIPYLSIRNKPHFIIRSVSLGYSSYHTAPFREEVKKWLRRNRMGWTVSAVFGHSWSSVFTEQDFQQHPDWFALVNGKRQRPQVCSTHPAVIDRMVEHVLKGKYDIMNISPADGGGFCQCNEETKSETHKKLNIPSCTSLDNTGLLSYDGKTPVISDRIFTYANEVARRVREKNPAKGCGIHAYTFYNSPPVKIEKLEPNLYISFVYQCAAHRDPENHKQWFQNVSGWKKLDAKMIVREGWGNHYYLDLPFLHYKQIITNLKEAAELGFVGVYGEGSKCFATQGPNYWALAKMMWDPYRDTSKIMDEFWQSAYGPAAEEMKNFFQTYSNALDENWSKRKKVMDTTGIAYVNLINSWNILFPEDVLEKAEKYLTAAEKKVSSGEYAERIKFHRVGHEYTKIMLELINCYQKLSQTGLKLEFFSSAVEKIEQIPEEERKKILLRAYELGEKREEMLLAHRDWAGMDEGLYAYTNDAGIRQWHLAVKKELGIQKQTGLSKEILKR
ncbi:MAG: DUF4838 domain-containing protein [Candidatus Omnitrophica bacterium]|nr:DUF4838 domain-containing protein [Candidatus Omnitrophota bacterium]